MSTSTKNAMTVKMFGSLYERIHWLFIWDWRVGQGLVRCIHPAGLPSEARNGLLCGARTQPYICMGWVTANSKRKQPNDFFLCLCAWVELGWGRREQPNMSLVLQCGSQSRLFYWYAVSPITVLLVPSPLLSPLQYLYSACCYLSCFHPSSHWLLLWYCCLLLL